MRVRTGRFRLDLERTVSSPFLLGGGGFDLYPCRFAPNPSMLPIVVALTLATPTGGIGLDVLHAVEGFFIGSALHGIESSGFEFTRAIAAPGSLHTTTTSADFPQDFPRGISPGKNALLPCTTATFTSTR
ncbi:MAG: hypothetical protein WCH98_18805 [Verrucomicrobiota bacterium]